MLEGEIGQSSPALKMLTRIGLAIGRVGATKHGDGGRKWKNGRTEDGGSGLVSMAHWMAMKRALLASYFLYIRYSPFPQWLRNRVCNSFVVGRKVGIY